MLKLSGEMLAGGRKTGFDEATVKAYLGGISDTIAQSQADVVLLQEVDSDSSRTYGIDERNFLSNGMSCEAYAMNYSCPFVPVPVPPIGKVHSGLYTMTNDLTIDRAERISLPCPFSWPLRIANLKRCLLVTRIPVSGSDKELVAINLHLEAYDDGSGKEAQTKKLFEILEQEAQAGNYVIAGGDFNQTFNNVDTSAYPTLSGKWQPGIIDVSSLSDSYQTLMDNAVPSCRSLDQPLDTAESKDPSAFQYYVIDGFLVSSNITINSFGTQDLQFQNSDHNPLLLNVTLQ